MPTNALLIDFEKKVKQAFLDKRIKAPIHLSGGNEDKLLEIFKNINQEDWVFSTWRSHYHAILKGIPEEWVFSEIIAGRSMFLINREHKFISSSIVGGILPIACGVAWALRRKSINERVWVFVGDMTARTGIYHEFIEYCRGHDLPVSIVIEDNGLSTNTPTIQVWGESQRNRVFSAPIKYSYKRVYPHVGCDEFVQF